MDEPPGTQTRCAGRAAVAHAPTVMVDGRCPVCGETESTEESRALVVRANKRWLDEAWFHAEVEMAVLVTNPPEHLRGTVRLAAAVALTIRDEAKGPEADDG